MLGNKNWFPSTQDTIEAMLDGVKLSYKENVLDPSAGDGTILEYIVENSGVSKSKVYAIENDPDLVAVLRDKGFNVVAYNFLTYHTHLVYDLVLMNPPFDQGAAHLLHAWDVARGSLIKCLLNAETIRNPYTRDRERLAHVIDKYGGQVQDLGRPFRDAPRTTDVEVVLVTLQKPEDSVPFRLGFEPERVPRNGNGQMSFDDVVPGNQLAQADVFEAHEAMYNAAMRSFVKLMEAQQEVAYYAAELVSEYKDPVNMIKEAMHAEPRSEYNGFLTELAKEAWSALFTKSKMAALVTQKVASQLSSMENQQGHMAFTADNMKMLYLSLGSSKMSIMEECVLDVFEQLTRYYPDNREVLEGWKTNDGFGVGKRFILPRIGDVHEDWGLSWDGKCTLADIEKALCFVAGKDYGRIHHVERNYERHGSWRFGQWYRSEFFETRLFKKQTMHFHFLDYDLKDRFNQVVAAKMPRWVPEVIKQGAYW